MRQVSYVFLISLSISFFNCAAESTEGALPTHAAAIARVEHGLIPGIPVEGQAGRPIHERMAVHDVPAVSVAVIEDFEVVWAKAWGVADVKSERVATPTTLFQAASISKPVTAMAVLRLVEAGRISLDTPVNEILESWKLPDNEFTRKTPVTFRMLLSHTGGTTVHGFPGYAPGTPLPSLMQVLDGAEPANTQPIRVDIPPGEKLRYSGGGITVVQKALIDLLDSPFPEILHKVVLTPSGMTSSTFAQPLPEDRLDQAAVAWAPDSLFGGKSHIYPEMAAAGLWTTPTDLARFATEIQRALRGDEGTVISNKTAEIMVTPVKAVATTGLFLRQKDGETYFMHGGSNRGFRCIMVAHRDRGYGAVVMTNGAGGSLLMNEVLGAIATTYGWKGFLPEAIQPVPLSSTELDAYTGRYRAGTDKVVILTPGDGVLLHSEVLGASVIPLYPVSDDTFRYAERFRGDRVFVRTPEGQITRIEVPGSDVVWDRLGEDERLPSELVASGHVDEAIAAYRTLEALKEDRLNDLGYRLLNDPSRIEDAVALLKLNTELFPVSFNTWDSLGDAYSAANKHMEAVESYTKSLDLNPSNSHAEEMIRNLTDAMSK